jgi:hypothetical protein
MKLPDPEVLRYHLSNEMRLDQHYATGTIYHFYKTILGRDGWRHYHIMKGKSFSDFMLRWSKEDECMERLVTEEGNYRRVLVDILNPVIVEPEPIEGEPECPLKNTRISLHQLWLKILSYLS